MHMRAANTAANPGLPNPPIRFTMQKNKSSNTKEICN